MYVSYIYCVFHIIIVCFITFLRLVLRIENNSQSVDWLKVTLRHWKTILCSMCLWQNLKKLLWEFYHLFVKIMPKGLKEVKAEITSFLTSDTSFCLPHFMRMLDNSYSSNVFKSECLLTWDCNKSAKCYACVLTCFACLTCFAY